MDRAGSTISDATMVDGAGRSPCTGLTFTENVPVQKLYEQVKINIGERQLGHGRLGRAVGAPQEGHHLRASAELVGREGRSVSGAVCNAGFDRPENSIHILSAALPFGETLNPS